MTTKTQIKKKTPYMYPFIFYIQYKDKINTL